MATVQAQPTPRVIPYVLFIGGGRGRDPPAMAAPCRVPAIPRLPWSIKVEPATPRETLAPPSPSRAASLSVSFARAGSSLPHLRRRGHWLPLAIPKLSRSTDVLFFTDCKPQVEPERARAVSIGLLPRLHPPVIAARSASLQRAPASSSLLQAPP